MKKLKEIIHRKVSENLNETKWYIIQMKQKSLNSIAVIGALSALDDSNKGLIGVAKGWKDPLDKDIVWLLYMDNAQRIAFEQVAKNYIVEMKEYVITQEEES